ncbi:hypothetical protein RWE15_23840 [Virgibacillus halophilus]|uniref:Uncharacterized protein n=1 Tax=Tigheibacillus halophilus TaxID=361280 RepID=A0ABU5CBR4_9BACI|nr:hypothetical protein [Virgibacillus halophilus]MDY0396770.1 hypothetical protein [Virgibacillus halophilus]
MVYELDRVARYIIPFLDDGPSGKRWNTFKKWWAEDIVLVDNNKNKLTRKDLILSSSNKDGGAHVDPQLDRAYAELNRKNTMGWVQVTDGKQSPVSDPHLASIRQIGYEVLQTLKEEFSDIIVV